MHGAHRSKMSSAYQRHQSLVRSTLFYLQSKFLIVIPVICFCLYSVTQTFFFFFFCVFGIRLEERGWIVSPPSSSSSSSSRREGAGAGGKGNASVVVVKTSKKKIDHERYLDATQRYVTSHILPYCTVLPFYVCLLTHARALSYCKKGGSSRP